MRSIEGVNGIEDNSSKRSRSSTTTIRLVSDDSPELPEPHDDGAAAHLPRRHLPATEMPASDGRMLRLDALPRRSVIFVYPAIGGPGRKDRLADWTAVPGARGCTPEACSFRDELAEFHAAGIDVFGLSGQNSSSQRKHVDQLGLNYPLVSDEALQLADEPGLPTFDFDGRCYYKRLTLIVRRGTIEAALYPIFPPDDAAAQAVRWISQNRLSA
jgi:peroxiredoxin